MMLSFISNAKVRIIFELTKFIVLIFLKIVFKFYYRVILKILQDYSRNNLMEIISRIEP